MVESIAKEDRAVIGTDFNRHFGEGNRGDGYLDRGGKTKRFGGGIRKYRKAS